MNNFEHSNIRKSKDKISQKSKISLTVYYYSSFTCWSAIYQKANLIKCIYSITKTKKKRKN